MDKDRRVSIETISAQFDVSVGTVHTIIHEELKIQKICAKFVPRVLREERRCHDSRELVELINSDHTVLCALVTCDESWMTQRPKDRVPSGSMLALPDPRRLDIANPPTNFWWSLFFDSTSMTVNKVYYVEVLREFRKRFRRKRPALFKSGQWHFHQDNAPVHNSILVTDYLTKMGIKTVLQPPYSPDLDPCDCWSFPNLRGCRYETIEEMKDAVTKVIDTLTQEDIHGAFQKLLKWYNKYIAARGDYSERDYSFMCVLSIKVPIRKKSGNLFNEPCSSIDCEFI